MQTVIASETVAVKSRFHFIDQIIPNFFKILQVFALGFIIYTFCQPAELSREAWLLFSIFVSSIFAIILKPFPMGAITVLAVGALIATKTISLSTVLQGFSNDLIWLIVMACFLGRGVIKTGLGRRIAYVFISIFGGSPLGLSYGLLLSATTMAPLIPSATARTGGIILPVLKSIVPMINDEKKHGRLAEYLTFIVLNSSVITSCMFITSNGGNPIVVKFAKNLGISIDWGTWALAALVPAVVCLILLPILLKFFIPCQLPDAAVVKAHAHEELKAMGKISNKEKITLVVFGFLLLFWSCGHIFNIQPTEAAILGVGLFLLCGIITWKDVLGEELAWDTFFWMAILIMMATEMQTLGVIDYFTKQLVAYIPASHWILSCLTVSLIYFYTHYFFASTTAHLSSMFPALVAILFSLGAPPLVTALAFGFLTNLCGGLTQYSSGPMPIIYAQGYIEFKSWLKIGFITSLFYLVVWLGFGFCWWKVLGLF